MRRPGDPYARLTLAEKQLANRDSMREPSVACPRCETQTTATDLLGHLQDRCGGPGDVHPASRWVSRSEALRWLPKRTLHRWAERGLVRQRGQGGGHRDREYLLRDLTRNLARRNVPRMAPLRKP